MKLTHKQIDEMEAGREMDALVEQSIFEHEIEMRLTSRGECEPYEIESLYDGSPCYTKDDLAERYKQVGNGYVSLSPCYVVQHDDFEEWLIVPQYSSNISAAWEVMEKFDRTYWDISIESDTEDEGELWGVAFTKWSDKEIGPIVMGASAHKELPLAICRTALKATI